MIPQLPSNRGTSIPLRFAWQSLLLSLLLPATVLANTGDTSNLISKNPFVPEATESNKIINKPGPPQSTPNKTPGILSKYLQFKSVAIINKEKFFSVFNRRTNKSLWIPENQTIESYRVTNYNPATKSITISDGINSELITIITSDEKPINVITSVTQTEETKELNPVAGQQTNSAQKRQPVPRRRVVSVKPKQE